MFNQVLPEQIDNAYRGHKLGVWLFALVVVVRIAQSLVVIFNGYSTAQSADGIPLDTYAPMAAQTVVALFALSGLYRLFIGLVCVLVLIRYRRAIPLMFALLLLNSLAAQLLLQVVPIVRVGNPPGPIVNLILSALMIVGLAVSLGRRGDPGTGRMTESGAT